MLVSVQHVVAHASGGASRCLGTMAYGNLVTAAGIMFSGASPIKFINAMNFSHVQFFSAKTYFNIQSSYLVPSVESVYRRLQSELLTDIILSGDDVRAGGDARCCSPGHTAKYSSYTIMDLTRSKILDVQLVQVCFTKCSLIPCSTYVGCGEVQCILDSACLFSVHPSACQITSVLRPSVCPIERTYQSYNVG